MREYWLAVFGLDGYEPASREESLKAAYAILEKLHGIDRKHYAAVGPGICDDCKKDVPGRFRLGRVDVCRHCLMKRSAAMRRTA